MAIDRMLKSLLLVGLTGLHALWLAYLWLYLGLGGDLHDLILVLMQLAALMTVAVVPLLLFAPRRIVWAVLALALAWSLSSAVVVVDARQTAQEHSAFNRQMAPERLAENRRLLQSALMKVPCTDGVTLTLNRKRFSDGSVVMSVSAVPADPTQQGDLLAVLSSAYPGRPLLPDSRRRLEAYGRRGPQLCRQGVASLLQQLDAFSRVGSKP